MNMALLRRIKKYIERMEVGAESEYGECRTLEELKRDKALPTIYYEVLKEMKKDGMTSGKQTCWS